AQEVEGGIVVGRAPGAGLRLGVVALHARLVRDHQGPGIRRELDEQAVVTGGQGGLPEYQGDPGAQAGGGIGADAPQARLAGDLLAVVVAAAEDVLAAAQHRPSVVDLEPLAALVAALTVLLGGPGAPDLDRGLAPRAGRTAVLG